MDLEFREIGHTGGQVTFRVVTNEEGNKGFQISWTHSRPTPAALVGIYALQQGIPVSSFNIGGIAQGWDPPLPPGCFPVFLSSDSEGKFGHDCGQCKGYWRSSAWPNVCPYCGNMPERHHTLSAAQRRYVKYYCDTLSTALTSEQDGDFIIDMDAVADAVHLSGDRPEFYVSEERQQHQFNCEACGSFNDVLGTYAYCSLCGTRNDCEVIKEHLKGTRKRLTDGAKAEDCLRDAVSSFDSFVAQHAKQLVSLVPMSKRRKARLERGRFHRLEELCSIFQEWFDINVSRSLSETDVSFLKLMFLRRHVYEHNGGEVDQLYIDESGDTNVRPKQLIRENAQDMHRVIDLLSRMSTNLHNDFHELFPPLQAPISDYKQLQARIKNYET